MQSGSAVALLGRHNTPPVPLYGFLGLNGLTPDPDNEILEDVGAALTAIAPGVCMSEYTHHLFVCGNQRPDGHPRGCCDPQGAELLRAAFKKALRTRSLRASMRANRSGCLDQCEHGPCVVIYPDAIWYGGVQLTDVDEILERHLRGGEIVQRLLIAEDCINNPDCPHRRKRAGALQNWLLEHPKK